MPFGVQAVYCAPDITVFLKACCGAMRLKRVALIIIRRSLVPSLPKGGKETIKYSNLLQQIKKL